MVTSALTATAEVAGDAALLVDPGDPHAVADALARILDDRALHARLRRAGRAQAAELSWARGAQRCVQGLQRGGVVTISGPGAGPARRLRVGVNLTWLVPGVVGGSEEYLVRSLLALPPPDRLQPEVVIFGLDALAGAHPELAERFELVTLPLRGRLKSARVAAESSWLAVQAHRRRLDVVHHGGGVLLWAPGRTVVTIHDLQPLELPASFSTLKRRWRNGCCPLRPGART